MIICQLDYIFTAQCSSGVCYYDIMRMSYVSLGHGWPSWILLTIQEISFKNFPNQDKVFDYTHMSLHAPNTWRQLESFWPWKMIKSAGNDHSESKKQNNWLKYENILFINPEILLSFY